MEQWSTVEEIKSAREAMEAAMPDYARPFAYGVGVATIAPGGQVLDVWYPHVNTDAHTLPVAVLATVLGHRSGTTTQFVPSNDLRKAIEMLAPAEACEAYDHPNLQTWRALLKLVDTEPPLGGSRQLVAAFLGSADDPIADACDAYLRLHLLSHRFVQPRQLNMDGVFGKLNNVVWTDRGPFDPDDFAARRAELAAQGVRVRVTSVDKFPQMLDYVVPSGVRIANADRVRLGAHLAEGTVVMHEGYCNFNAGTLGPAMVEGRISAGVVVGANSDIGGGASIQGTLSGGGTEVVTIGEGCLLGANGGVGISLGDDCTVEAGLYVTAGTIVRLPDGSTAKGRELSGQSGILYLRNSLTGEVEARAKKGGNFTGLNPDLHS